MSTLTMRRFVDRLTTLADHNPQPKKLALAAGELLESVLAFDHVLEDSEREPDPDHYRQHILHVDPAGRFSVVALVWLPGHATAIHDHVSWCAAGILAGRELEHRFDLTRDPNPALRQTTTTFNNPGEISVLPEGPDIHQVSCASGDRTVSLHVYGADITRTGTSINITYGRELLDPR